MKNKTANRIVYNSVANGVFDKTYFDAKKQIVAKRKQERMNRKKNRNK